MRSVARLYSSYIAAVEQYQVLLRQRPELHDARLELANCYRALRQWDAALLELTYLSNVQRMASTVKPIIATIQKDRQQSSNFANAHPSSPSLIRCPQCRKPSDSIKCFRMGVLIFFFIGYVAQWKDKIGCPTCIRRAILVFVLVNLLSANLVWPLLILPMSIFHLMRSYEEGHSPIVLKNVR